MNEIFLIVPLEEDKPDYNHEDVIAYGDMQSVDMYLVENKIPRDTVFIQKVTYIRRFL